MLHGVLVLCRQTGGLFYSKAYTKNFGLPPSCASDSHNLASLIFALQLNASAVVGQSNNAAVNRNQVHGSSDTPSLKQVEMHGLLVTFDSSGRLLLALFVSPSLGPKATDALRADLLQSLSDKFSAQLAAMDARSGVRKLAGASACVHACMSRMALLLLADVASQHSSNSPRENAAVWANALVVDSPVHRQGQAVEQQPSGRGGFHGIVAGSGQGQGSGQNEAAPKPVPASGRKRAGLLSCVTRRSKRKVLVDENSPKLWAGASPISVSWGEGGDATLAGNAYIDAVKKGQIHDVSSEALAVYGEEWRIQESVLMKRENGGKDEDDDDDDDDDSGIGCFHATRRRKRCKSQSGQERAESDKAGGRGMCIIGAREGRIMVSLGLRGGLEGGGGLGFLSFGDAGSRLVQWMGFMADHKVYVKL